MDHVNERQDPDEECESTLRPRAYLRAVVVDRRCGGGSRDGGDGANEDLDGNDEAAFTDVVSLSRSL